MKYVDTVRLAITHTDGYGDQSVDVLADVRALFIQRTGADHAQNAEMITSDALVYLDPADGTVLNNSYRLEGMYVIANPFGQTDEQSWYKIIGVNVGQRKLLNNTVDNILCQLQKVGGLAYVS
jgi:hypothetical protein